MIWEQRSGFLYWKNIWNVFWKVFSSQCLKSSFFVQKFNFDFSRKFFGVKKNSWKCCGFELFSYWQFWFDEKNRENVGICQNWIFGKKIDFSNSVFFTEKVAKWDFFWIIFKHCDFWCRHLTNCKKWSLLMLTSRFTSKGKQKWNRRSTLFENHRKSIIQHCERSELRLHFEWTKVN